MTACDHVAGMRDGQYSQKNWPLPSMFYQDLEWLLPHRLPQEDVTLSVGYSMNPDETEENSIQGPIKDKIFDALEEMITPSLTEDAIEAMRPVLR